MTNSQSLFGEQDVTPKTEAAIDQSQAAEEGTQGSVYNEVVGEGKRFRDAEALAKAKLEADTHIKRIEEENAELRKKNGSMATNYDAILAKLEEKKAVSVYDKKDAGKISESTEVDLDSWFESKLSEREKKLIEQANVQKARELMISTYGNVETANKIFEDLKAEKPYLVGGLNDLLKSDPNAFLNEVKFFKSPSQIGYEGNDPVGTIPNVPENRDARYLPWSEVCKVRRTDLKKYNTAEFKKLVEDSVSYYKSKGVNYYAT